MKYTLYCIHGLSRPCLPSKGEGWVYFCRLSAFTHFLCFVMVGLVLSSVTVKFPTEKFQHEEVF